MLSIIIPVYNEEGAIEQTVRTLHEVMDRTREPFELIVVNDGSTDATGEIVARLHFANLHIMTHSKNRGNGAAIMTGLAHAKGDLIGTVDADGTYPLEDYPALLTILKQEGVDMVVGARTKPGAHIPFLHRPAKFFLTTLAQILTGRHIADINSGMRIMKRGLLEEFQALYPERFSLHITLTVAAMLNDARIRYEPINYHERIGESTMTKGMNGIAHFVRFIGQILDTTGHFRPRLHTTLQFMVYVGSGGTAAFLNYTTYLLLLWSGIYYLYASTTSEVVGFFSAFLLHKYVVFRKSGQMQRHFGRYCLLSTINFVILTGILYALVEYLSISEESSKLIAMALVVLWNFVAYKFFVYV